MLHLCRKAQFVLLRDAVCTAQAAATAINACLLALVLQFLALTATLCSNNSQHSTEPILLSLQLL
jgi:hypothetical protein